MSSREIEKESAAFLGRVLDHLVAGDHLTRAQVARAEGCCEHEGTPAGGVFALATIAPMKPNDTHHWTITLYGMPAKKMDVSQITHVGDIQSALAAADEQEDEVAFEVQQFVITRTLPSLADYAEAWAHDNGRKVPRRDTPAWDALYQEWHAFAFQDFRPATAGATR